MPGQLLPSTDPVFISIMSPECIGTEMMGLAINANGGAGAFVGGTLYAVPFRVRSAFNVVKGFVYEQAGITTDVDIGVYDSQYNLIVSSGNVNHASVNDLKEFSLGPLMLGPGNYYMAISAAGNLTAAVVATSTLTYFMRGMGAWYVNTSSNPLPSNPTPAVWAAASMPIFGLSQRSLVA